MPIYTDLRELKKVLTIDPNDHSEDFTLNLYNEWASEIIGEILDRDPFYKVRTWYYQGSGTQKLLLKHRPVYPLAAPSFATSVPFQVLTVTLDSNGFFGYGPGSFTSDGTTQSLVFGSDYTIKPDQEDGGSREAILYRINDYWTKPFYRQTGSLSPFVGTDLGSIQVKYTAGYTIDSLPGPLRLAADWLVTRLAYIFPLGMQLSSESYIDRSIGITENQRRYLMGAVRPQIMFFKNWTW